MATLYLNPEGILFPQVSPVKPTAAAISDLAENAANFDKALRAFPATNIVLHCWFVYYLGYRSTVARLSADAQARVVGATVPGNRLYRSRSSFGDCRRDWLYADIRRRAPAHPMLMDWDWGQVRPGMLEFSLILKGKNARLSYGELDALHALMRDATDADAAEESFGCVVARSGQPLGCGCEGERLREATPDVQT